MDRQQGEDAALSEFIRPIGNTTLSDGWGLVQRHEYELRRRSGEWQRQIRETYDQGDGAGVLLCDPGGGTVILTRQFRYPAFYRGEPPFLIEVCAGKLEGDDPETCARREAREETGYAIGRLEQVCACFSSPGSVTERLTLFLGFIDAPPPEAGGGLHQEGEDIEVLRLPFATALEMMRRGEIADAKTIILLQAAELRGVFGG